MTSKDETIPALFYAKTALEGLAALEMAFIVFIVLKNLLTDRKNSQLSRERVQSDIQKYHPWIS